MNISYFKETTVKKIIHNISFADVMECMQEELAGQGRPVYKTTQGCQSVLYLDICPERRIAGADKLQWRGGVAG